MDARGRHLDRSTLPLSSIFGPNTIDCMGIDCKGTGGGDVEFFGSMADVKSVEGVDSLGVLLLPTPPMYSLSLGYTG